MLVIRKEAAVEVGPVTLIIKAEVGVVVEVESIIIMVIMTTTIEAIVMNEKKKKKKQEEEALVAAITTIITTIITTTAIKSHRIIDRVEVEAGVAVVINMLENDLVVVLFPLRQKSTIVITITTATHRQLKLM